MSKLVGMVARKPGAGATAFRGVLVEEFLGDGMYFVRDLLYPASDRDKTAGVKDLIKEEGRIMHFTEIKGTFIPQSAYSVTDLFPGEKD